MTNADEIHDEISAFKSCGDLKFFSVKIYIAGLSKLVCNKQL